ncbi:MAG: hypothetical protein OHK0047_05210 [Leptolyngbyaceae cyanobacterium]|uniref:hypothetical protein n=1 Tax=Leptodesmis sichuanensis TaxID=2906798 RepID=UPI001F1913D9|nr:hypothetical protein [Leptodesmis sichuanensis]UIE40561.1 hypothetical protein KIK02_16105 [Leptodesmis sichuanensis A121]
MEAFDPNPPDWTQTATHAAEFQCPSCRALSKAATRVWINRRSPVYTEDRRRKWQEFYLCECHTAWWAWSSDRPPSELANQEREMPPRPEFFNPFED